MKLALITIYLWHPHRKWEEKNRKTSSKPLNFLKFIERTFSHIIIERGAEKNIPFYGLWSERIRLLIDEKKPTQLEITVLSDKQNKNLVRGLVGFTEFRVTNKTKPGKRFAWFTENFLFWRVWFWVIKWEISFDKQF